MTTRGRGDHMRVAALLGLVAMAAGCESQKPEDAWWTKVKAPTYATDSTRMVQLAAHALGDSLPMRVESITKGSQGWSIRLLPIRGGLPGGGTVYVDAKDSVATVMTRY